MVMLMVMVSTDAWLGLSRSSTDECAHGIKIWQFSVNSLSLQPMHTLIYAKFLLNKTCCKIHLQRYISC